MQPFSRLARSLRRRLVDEGNRALAARSVRQALSLADAPRSSLFFTHHKCASTFVIRMIQRVDAAAPGLRAIDYETVFWNHAHELRHQGHSHPTAMEVFTNLSSLLFAERGFIYGPLRFPFPMAEDERFNRIFFLRDPRDTLVSLYHSISESHPLPPDRERAEAMLRERQRSLDDGIDRFVLDQAEAFEERIMRPYRQSIRRGGARAFLFRYEEFIDDPQSTVARMVGILCGEANALSAERILADETFVQRNRRKHHHQRSGRFGQYLDELKPLTIARLDRVFAEHLQFLEGGRRAAA